MEGIELRVLKGLESVNDNGFCDLRRMKKLKMKEQAVTTSPREVPTDGSVGKSKDTGCLPKSGSVDREVGDGCKLVSLAEPICRRKGSR